MPQWCWLMLGGWALAAVLMACLWPTAVRIRNAALVDVGWGIGLGMLAIYFAISGEGAEWRRWLVAGLVVVWAGRLSWHLLRDRILGKPEEGRYQTMRSARGEGANRFFFVFFQAQALLDAVLAVPFLLACEDAATEFGIFEVAGVVLWLSAFAGEALADRQLQRFKHDAGNKGKVCQVGLWAYSRHPNYFFEWLIWCAYALLALAGPWGWLGWISPALILFFILRVTGIPPTEAQALASRGEAYREYQRSTSAFVPWFRRG